VAASALFKRFDLWPVLYLNVLISIFQDLLFPFPQRSGELLKKQKSKQPCKQSFQFGSLESKGSGQLQSTNCKCPNKSWERMHGFKIYLPRSKDVSIDNQTAEANRSTGLETGQQQLPKATIYKKKSSIGNLQQVAKANDANIQKGKRSEERIPTKKKNYHKSAKNVYKKLCALTLF